MLYHNNPCLFPVSELPKKGVKADNVFLQPAAFCSSLFEDNEVEVLQGSFLFDVHRCSLDVSGYFIACIWWAALCMSGGDRFPVSVLQNYSTPLYSHGKAFKSNWRVPTRTGLHQSVSNSLHTHIVFSHVTGSDAGGLKKKLKKNKSLRPRKEPSITYSVRFIYVNNLFKIKNLS